METYLNPECAPIIDFGAHPWTSLVTLVICAFYSFSHPPWRTNIQRCSVSSLWLSTTEYELKLLPDSEQMSLVQLIITTEVAHDTVAELGELGNVEFKDVSLSGTTYSCCTLAAIC